MIKNDQTTVDRLNPVCVRKVPQLALRCPRSIYRGRWLLCDLRTGLRLYGVSIRASNATNAYRTSSHRKTTKAVALLWICCDNSSVSNGGEEGGGLRDKYVHRLSICRAECLVWKTRSNPIIDVCVCVFAMYVALANQVHSSMRLGKITTQKNR